MRMLAEPARASCFNPPCADYKGKNLQVSSCNASRPYIHQPFGNIDFLEMSAWIVQRLGDPAYMAGKTAKETGQAGKAAA